MCDAFSLHSLHRGYILFVNGMFYCVRFKILFLSSTELQPPFFFSFFQFLSVLVTLVKLSLSNCSVFPSFFVLYFFSLALFLSAFSCNSPFAAFKKFHSLFTL